MVHTPLGLKDAEAMIWFRAVMVIWLALFMEHSAVAEELPAKESGTKLVRGVVNICTGWLEFPKQIRRIADQEGWGAGLWRGPLEGLGMFVARTVSGAYEVLTFPVPIPARFQPLLTPDFIWQRDDSSSVVTARPSQ
jgi:putative exosortase-associated protein (TIGR04073 family)